LKIYDIWGHVFHNKFKAGELFWQNIILQSCALESIAGSTDIFLLYGTVFKMCCKCFP